MRDPAPESPAQELAFLVVCTLAVLAPFVGKAVHMDDPLFVWAAQRIVIAPLDYYGIVVNWYGVAMPLGDVAMNPPLFAFWLAPAGVLGNWSEIGLHLAVMPLAVAAVAGTWQLARGLCGQPRLAALSTLAAPAFLVAGTTLMCDMLMLALWTWSIVQWRAALASGRWSRFAACLVLALLAIYSKYFALALLPLFALHLAFSRAPHRGRGLLSLALLAASVAAIELCGAARGNAHAVTAMRYAIGQNDAGWTALWQDGVAGLGFLGGGTLAFHALGFVCGPRRGILLAIAGALILFASGWLRASGSDGATLLQVLLAGSGVAAIIAVLASLRFPVREDAVLLGAWFAGTLVFALWVNWTVNFRALLPLVPAWSIVFVRLLERGVPVAPRWLQAAIVVPMLAFSLWLAAADYRMAESARVAARDIAQRAPAGQRLWFEGHWGFQYYAQQAGAIPLDLGASTLHPGDIVAVPMNNTNLQLLPAGLVRAGTVLEYPAGSLATMSLEARAGMYSSVWGPLPFVIGAIPPERYVLLEVQQQLRFGRG